MEATKEFIVGSSAGVLASVMSNPFDYAKTKMQLQGELQKAGSFTTSYRNIPDVIVKTIKTEGFMAVQSGLLAASIFQFVRNGSRLGMYQMCLNKGWLNNEDGSRSIPKSVFFGALSGAASSYISSPAYMIRAQMQAASKSNIKVGLHQRRKMGLYESYKLCLAEVKIEQAKDRFDYVRRWVASMWRGCHITAIRLTMGSSIQLSTFTVMEEFFEKRLPNMSRGTVKNSMLTAVCAATMTALLVNPFDLVATRMLNQPIDPATLRGLHYHSFLHCFSSSIRSEGFFGLYKGTTAQMYRVGVHSIFLLFIWRQLHKLIE